MNQGQTIFAQIMEFISHDEFRRCVHRYDGNRSVRRLSCWNQFLAMAFAQLTYRHSLRDIEVCLRAQRSKLYHCGFKAPIRRSTLADANERRDWRIYADFARTLIDIARPLYATSRTWGGSGRHGLCPGRHHHRSVPECFPLGHLQASQGSHQASHADGSPQLYSRLYRHHSRQSPRHSSARCDCPRAWLFFWSWIGLTSISLVSMLFIRRWLSLSCAPSKTFSSAVATSQPWTASAV